MDTRGKQRIQRRALNDDEARRLLACPRKLLYLLAMHTGLRRGEINALHGGDFHLDAVNPYWAPPAAFVKNRKEQPRPLHPELVAELQKLKAAGKLKPEDTVFPERVPPMKTIRADFKAAGIPLKDERGHVVDFHALRTTTSPGRLNSRTKPTRGRNCITTITRWKKNRNALARWRW